LRRHCKRQNFVLFIQAEEFNAFLVTEVGSVVSKNKRQETKLSQTYRASAAAEKTEDHDDKWDYMHISVRR